MQLSRTSPFHERSLIHKHSIRPVDRRASTVLRSSDRGVHPAVPPSLQESHRTRETGLHGRAVPTPRTPGGSVTIPQPPRGQAGQRAHSILLGSGAQRSLEGGFRGQKQISFVLSGMCVDLEALCCTQEEEISATDNSQRRQTRTRDGIGARGAGAGALLRPRLFEKPLGFWGTWMTLSGLC